ncbi:GvpL/GvpF family gas vesicle protein [Thermoleptolyngbya sp. C42_A2020_037]|uniref:GvpL/GvpF family gas vesicle protein n=1 Tax=Thermoleptolyngbya sp. C42_A2020_037 TaxID=2747799 RepID=UPI001A0BE663|nr:GvpL/GvpF family gas vesicle protein [Thermoleptolyngbya sp. C42_A2020_037]MBF2083222.1 GvpL/GvpF family gas vesicle protein [Thermoleptolyngbya sp. C42_A2020_037]
MYTYAFVLQSTESIVLPAGISGELMLLYERGVGAVVEPGLDLAMLEQSDERLMRAVLHHDQVIREVFEQVPVLPLRFGTQFVSQEKLLEHLHVNAAAYQATLTRLVGQAEYTLKLSPRSPESSAPSPLATAGTGRDYFLAKKQQFQQQLDRQQQQQAELLKLKEAIAQDYPALQIDAPRDGIERLHLLVKRTDEALLHESLEEWRSRCPGWQMALSEALPPYHFV